MSEEHDDRHGPGRDGGDGPAFAAWLLGELKNRGEPQTSFARRTGIGTPTLVKWKQGEAHPTADMVRRVAEALDMTHELLRLMVIARILTPEEALQSADTEDITLASDEDLTAEALRRMKENR